VCDPRDRSAASRRRLQVSRTFQIRPEEIAPEFPAVCAVKLL